MPQHSTTTQCHVVFTVRWLQSNRPASCVLWRACCVDLKGVYYTQLSTFNFCTTSSNSLSKSASALNHNDTRFSLCIKVREWALRSLESPKITAPPTLVIATTTLCIRSLSQPPQSAPAVGPLLLKASSLLELLTLPRLLFFLAILANSASLLVSIATLHF